MHSIFLRSRIQYFFARAFSISLRRPFVGGDQQTGVKSALTGVHTACAPQIALIVTDQQGIELCVKRRSQLQCQVGQIHLAIWTDTL